MPSIQARKIAAARMRVKELEASVTAAFNSADWYRLVEQLLALDDTREELSDLQKMA